MTDNAKELLALAAELHLLSLGEWADGLIGIPIAMQKASDMLERLSARQQASVEEVARSIAFQEWPLARTDERAKWVETHWQRYAPEARALLAKYDIFEKVEG